MAAITIYDLMPDPEALLTLEPEELAGNVLQYLNEVGQQSGQLNRYNFGLIHTVIEFPSEYHTRIRQALMEAWVWLEREGLLAPRPEATGHEIFITRRGKQLASPDRLNKYRAASQLPREMLHARIAQPVWATFLRGDYDTAVFQAMKEVEVSVREASGLPDKDIGMELMRKAFKTNDGALSDALSPNGEQEALAHLFAGAIGSYKNPHSHRNVKLEPREAVESE